MRSRNSRDSLSVLIAAYNEEENILDAVKSVYSALKGLIFDYEIIIINDGSTDKTGRIIASLAKKDNRIKVITHRRNLGFGRSIRDGLNLARKTYLTGFPGDNDMSAVSLRELIKERKSADLIISYMANTSARPLVRRLASAFFVVFMNLLFGLHLRYYNGYFIAKTKLIKSLSLCSEGLAIFAEAIVRLIKQGVKYKEIPFIHEDRKTHQSKALSFKSVVQTLKTVGILVKDVYFLNS